MTHTKTPMLERMTLFWHNHFTSSLQKVKWPQLMYRQNTLLRYHALGNFRELLHLIAKDPAMILYLDNQTNNRTKPNENFARDFSKGRPSQYIVVGLIFTVLLIMFIIGMVKFVMYLAGV